MNIYKISQDKNNGYDTYDAAIVSAPNETEARKMSPKSYSDKVYHDFNEIYSDWAPTPNDIQVEYIGVYHKDVQELILSSFNAG